MYTAEIIDHWMIVNKRNVSQLSVDYLLPIGASLVDSTGTPAKNLTPVPNNRTSLVNNVPLSWLDTVATDSNYFILWQREVI